MDWKQDRPTTAGHYWYCDKYNEDAQMVYFDLRYVFVQGGCYCPGIDGFWQGPLAKPDSPIPAAHEDMRLVDLWNKEDASV